MANVRSDAHFLKFNQGRGPPHSGGIYSPLICQTDGYDNHCWIRSHFESTRFKYKFSISC